MKKSRTISLIQNGTVIDHIEPEAVFKIVKILGIDKCDDQVTVGNNLKSKYFGRKGIIKVENVFLSKEDVNKISIISPHVSINIIEDYQVTKKFKVEIPESVEGIIACQNPNCVTNVEGIRTRFNIITKEPLALFCNYCERSMLRDDIEVRSIKK